MLDGIELPEIAGPTQREFEIKNEASYIVSVKNPEIQVTLCTIEGDFYMSINIVSPFN